MRTVCAFLAAIAAIYSIVQADVVYTNDFESQRTTGLTTDADAGEWTNPVLVSRTPDGTRHFLGEFGNQSVRLTLTDLPPHDTLTVAFDLLVLRSWDGNVDPDVWELRADSSLLISTTFSNVIFPQAYPGPYPAARMDARTGAAEYNSMGYTWSEPDVFEGPMDARYRLEFRFAHSGPSVDLEYTARLSDVRPYLGNESWGIDNVVIHTGVPDDPSPGEHTGGAGPDIPHYDLSDVVITMRRGACFGRCPIYTVSIYGSGRVEFRGDKFVAQEGIYTDSIPPEQVNRLVHALHTMGFFTMQDRYDNRYITDLPATTTSFESGATTKSVYNYYGAPAELRAIERLIDQTAGTERWIRGQ